MRAAAAVTAAFLFAILPSEPSQGAQERQIVGKWQISIERDRFDDSPFVIAATEVPGGAFAVRCIKGELNFIITAPGRVRVIEREVLTILARVDKKPIRTITGVGLDKNTVMGELWRVLYDDLRGGQELALRINTKELGGQDIFVSLDRADAALKPVGEACGVK